MTREGEEVTKLLIWGRMKKKMNRKIAKINSLFLSRFLMNIVKTKEDVLSFFFTSLVDHKLH